MKRAVKARRAQYCRQIWACLVLLFCLAQGVEVRPQRMSDGDVLAPPKPNLVALHWPDLTKLEADVREQLVSLQASLAAAVKYPQTPETTLSEAYGTMGQIYHAYSLNAAARESYLNASLIAPKDFRWIYLLAKLDQQEGFANEAIRRFQIARSLNSDYAAVSVNLGNLYLELNRLDDAKASFTAALAIEARNAAAHYGLGQAALSRRSYAEAVEHFKEALARAPEANRIHYSLAMAYRGLGDAEKAKTHLAQHGVVGVRTSDPLVDGLQELIKGERVHLIRGRLALEAKRYAEAAAEFRRAIAAKPDSVTAHVNLGAALTQTGDLKGAAEQFEKTLRIDPENTNAHYNLAVLLARENKHDLAIAHLQSVSRANPNDLNARFLLAQQFLKTTRLDEALAEFSFVSAANPDNEEALLERVKLLYLKRQYREALDELEKAHARYPQRGQTALMLAYVLAVSPPYNLRDGARALKLAQLVYDASGSVEHGVVVSMALAELGRCREAAEWQRKMIGQLEKQAEKQAEQQGMTAMLSKLKADLTRYENTQSCRPEGEAP